MKGGIIRTSQLRDIELTEFVTTGAAELTILQSMDYINQGEVEKAMDVLATRITAPRGEGIRRNMGQGCEGLTGLASLATGVGGRRKS